MDGVMFAQMAIEFTALAMISQRCWARCHLFALAVEMAFKSLALRAGCTPEECKKASHQISKMISLVERFGPIVPPRIKQRLGDDDWFKSMLNARYPTTKTEVFVHADYPEMIAEILEIQCSSPLRFEGGSASAEIESMVKKLQAAQVRKH